jgi:hypothetical protein
MRIIGIALALVAACKPTQPQFTEDSPVSTVSDRPNTTTFSRGSGGSVTTTLGFGIKLNPNSSLQREWITAHDSLSPVDLGGTVGVATTYKSGGEYSTGGYHYEATLPLTFKDDVQAFEIRFVLFDVWGQFTRTLSYTEIEDEITGTTKSFTPSWSLYSENEATEHYASLAYVARVRTKAGRVFEANYQPVVDEARKISARFQPEWLEPNPTPRPDSTRSRK